MIPLVDLKTQYKKINGEIHKKIDEVFESGAFIQGKYATEFEEKFADMLAVKNVIGCSNGTSAISLTLEALGVEDGDEVITTPHTFIATAEAICHAGARPVFVDINPETYNIDIDKIVGAITEKTKVIIPVHIYGNPCNMTEIKRIAYEHNLKIVEDCAQSHFAGYNGIFTGNFGDAGTFSFYPGKNLGAYGDAGAVVTNNDELANKVRMLLDHGRKDKYIHQIVGYNQRMDGLQAAILSVKLNYIMEWTEKRRYNAGLYKQKLSGIEGVTLPYHDENVSHVYHLFVIQIDNRDGLMEHLKYNQIASGVHYPVPLHLQSAFEYLGYKKGDFPVCERISERIMSLPMCSELDENHIEIITDEVIKFIRK